MYAHSNRQYIKYFLGIIFLFVLFLFIKQYFNESSKLEKLQSEKTNWVRSEVTSMLLNYQFAYLRPPKSINDLIENLKMFQSKRISSLTHYLEENEKLLRLDFSYKEGFVYLYHIGFDNIDNKLQKVTFYPEEVNPWNLIFCKNYDFILTYYEIPTKCLDDQYRVYTGNSVYTSYDNYDSLVQLFTKPIKRNWINESGEKIKFNAIININFTKDTVKIEPCDSSVIISNSFIKSNDLRKLMMEIDWGNKPDSLYIPILQL